MIRRPPRSTLFPSTPLFRSARASTSARRRSPSNAGAFAVLAAAASASADPRSPVVAASIAANNPAACERSEEHTSELQSRQYLVCRLLLEKKKKYIVQPLQY